MMGRGGMGVIDLAQERRSDAHAAAAGGRMPYERSFATSAAASSSS
ncbi:hypothetical protein DB31_4619 [Hyalangium minutum]|uniref:Uncharacterized protein n=1 Tax=Hyalangium minutum TaxID=394096 RepID=A0A085VZY2_9BACT|nr:hypothetical protein DB31_4619 [Hyalangium minutum]